MISIGTLHRLCMNTLGVSASELTVAKLAEWNDFVKSKHRSAYRLSASTKEDPDAPFDGRPEETRGDQLLARLDGLRHRMEPVPEFLKPFADLWREWKDEGGLHDFTDLIELAARESVTPRMEGGLKPDTLVIDECQDSTKLELHLVRSVWGPNVDRVFLAGDPDQCLYEWRAADPRVFMDYPDAESTVLEQSYRVPRTVHAFAQRVIRRIRDRDDVSYKPRDAEGEVIGHIATCRTPGDLRRDLPKWMSEGSVMFLAPTQYSLNTLCRWLRQEGVPFWNPWAPRRGNWNPILRKPRRRGEKTTLQRYLAFLREPDWSREDLLHWLPMLKGMLHRGALDTMPLSDPYRSEEFEALWKDPANAIRAFDGDSEWLADNVLKRVEPQVRFFSRVTQVGHSLDEDPKVVVGTIHSVKGATADTVVIFPDLTPAIVREMDEGNTGPLIRAFYVAATRARNRLVLASPGGRMSFDWRR
jgi:superfamily I DNA/RNA helicase